MQLHTARTLIAWFNLKVISCLITPLGAEILKQMFDPFNQGWSANIITHGREGDNK